MYFAFAVFPKTAELFQPPKGTLNHPPPGERHKCMKLIAFSRRAPYLKITVNDVPLGKTVRQAPPGTTFFQDMVMSLG
jgi:hypothetical protein